MELLLCCARTSVEAEQAEHLKILLKETLDWQYLMRMADIHGVVPLLYRSLHGCRPSS